MNLEDISLSHLDLTGAKFKGANLTGVDFSRATMEGVDLTDAFAMHPLKFSGTNLLSANMHVRAGTVMQFSAANLGFADLSNMKLSGVDFGKSSFQKTNLHGADLSAATLTGSETGASDFSNANLAGAHLPANLRYVNLQGADLSSDDFARVDLTGAVLAGANLTGATWDPAICPDKFLAQGAGATCQGHLAPAS